MGDEGSCVSLAEELIVSIEAFQQEVDETHPSGRSSLWAGAFPTFVSVGEGPMIALSPDIKKLIWRFSQALQARSWPSSKRNFRDADWVRLVGKIFCREWDRQRSGASTKACAEALVEAVQAELQRSISKIQPREYIFGCHLSVGQDGQLPDPLAIGSVKFFSWQDWLDDRRTTGGLTAITARRLQRAWSGRPLRPRKSLRDAVMERGILEAVGNCPTVCCVRIGPAADEAGRRIALGAARTALAAIALAWETPSSALERILLAFDRNSYVRHYASFDGSGRLDSSGSSSSLLPAGLSSMESDCGKPLSAECAGLSERSDFGLVLCWKHLVSRHAAVFSIVREVVSYATRVGPQDSGRQKLLHALFQALFRFYQGCREDDDAMAAVEFCSSMDALAYGAGEDGIVSLGHKRLGLKDETSRSAFRDFVADVYGDRRGPTVHGNDRQFEHDSSSKRAGAEHLARLLLLRCLTWVSEHPEVTNPRALRKAS